jgi:hypothetical protein
VGELKLAVAATVVLAELATQPEREHDDPENEQDLIDGHDGLRRMVRRQAVVVSTTGRGG